MRVGKTKMGITLVAIYGLLVIAAAIFLFFQINDTPFAGVYIIMLTAPWSLLVYLLFDFMGIKVTARVDIILLVFFTITNAFILYIVATKWTKRGKSAR